MRDPHHSVGLSLDRLLTDAQQQGRIDLPDSLAGRERNGEPARLVRDESGAVQSVWLGGSRVVGEEDMKVEMLARYVERAGG